MTGAPYPQQQSTQPWSAQQVPPPQPQQSSPWGPQGQPQSQQPFAQPASGSQYQYPQQQPAAWPQYQYPQQPAPGQQPSIGQQPPQQWQPMPGQSAMPRQTTPPVDPSASFSTGNVAGRNRASHKTHANTTRKSNRRGNAAAYPGGPTLSLTKRKPWLIPVAILAAIVLVFSSVFTVSYFLLKADGAMDGIMADSTLPTKEQAYAGMPADQYDLRDPIAVDTYYKFRIILKNPAKVVAGDGMGFELKGAELSAEESARVFQDSSLSVPIPTYAFAGTPIGDKEGTGTIDIDGSMDIPEDMQHGDSIGKDRGFLPSDGYYYVQYLGEDGKKLAKPIVQFFRVKEHTDIERLPVVRNIQSVVNENGGVDISWNKVDGAQSYNVYTYIIYPQVGQPGESFYSEEHGAIKKLGTSKTTQLLSKDYDKPEERDSDIVGPAVIGQNEAFQSLMVESQDSIDRCQQDSDEYCADLLQRAGGSWDADSAGRLYFVVTAVDADGHEGRWYAVDANDLVPSIPIRVAGQAQINQWSYNLRGVFGEDNTVEQDMEAYVYTFVQMANGATVPVPSEFSDLHRKDGSDGSWEFTYSAPGTLLSDTGSVWYEGDLNAVFPQVTQTALQSLPKAGGLLDRQRAASGDVDWTGYDDKKIDSDTKESPYFTFASNDYGKYLANNILNGHQVIDISKYATDEYQSSTEDVMDEVIYQNPYLRVSTDAVQYTVRKKGDKLVMWVKYADDYQSRQQQLDQFVKSAVGQFQGSDRDKAIAIDQFLAAHITYDYDAYAAVGFGRGSSFDNAGSGKEYPDAWSSFGVVNGKGVCMAYAYAFQALAKASGLDTRVVTGNVSGSSAGHAWNFVNIDGQWLVMDSTWDDDGTTASDRYQLKPQSEVTDHFTGWDRWTLASQVSRYK
ncbi:transglutaminase-like domain-containing protein [Bifidobacterium sp. SO4]|uniref:transglutaminase domain-containing protein n=1 Tax=Bifidobacterium sp. SO4 TaxID=2809030 RepID=UPI001BDDAA99|nr:transglutaminase-like domain-containing protein [Bifidobacterium sp. SO4]MBT1170757.1 transglutaminase domain-containing protein [Bifidobacterium sp. SO4]